MGRVETSQSSSLACLRISLELKGDKSSKEAPEETLSPVGEHVYGPDQSRAWIVFFAHSVCTWESKVLKIIFESASNASK